MVLAQTTFPSFKRDKYTTQGGIVNPYTTNGRVDVAVGLSITTSGGSPMSVNATFQGGAISVTSGQDLMPKLAEWHIYGNEQQGRFVTRKPETEPLYYLANLTSDVKNQNFFRILDKKEYELKDHLGNVRVAIGDMKLPENEATSTRGVPPFVTDEKAVNDYYPYGMTIADRSYSTAGYRYGYNGKENDNEVKGTGNSVDFGERIYDPRVAKFLSIDPFVNKFPNQSGYLYAGDSPIFSIDENGLFKKIVNYYEDEKGNQTVLRVDIDNSAKYDCYLIKGMFRVKPNTVEYVRWDAHSKKISSSGDLPLTNIGDTRYVGPWNPPDLGPNNPDYRYPPLNSLDKAALKHDKAYDKVRAKGFVGMMMNTDVIDADIKLVKSSLEVVKLFVTGQNDPVTKTRVDAVQATAAVGVALLFLDMVEQKALRIGGDNMMKMVKDLSREVKSAVNEVKDVVSEVNDSLNSNTKDN